MSKSLKILLAVLVLISITASLFIIFEWGPFLRRKHHLSKFPVQPTVVPEEGTPEETPFPSLEEIPAGVSFASPVEEKYLEMVYMNEEYPQSLSFSLKSQAPIKAVFSGKVTKVLSSQDVFPNSPLFENIFLEKKNGEFVAEYLVFGETLVNENEIVEEGQVLAKAKEKEGINLSFWLYSRDKNFFKLSKEIFK